MDGKTTVRFSVCGREIRGRIETYSDQRTKIVFVDGYRPESAGMFKGTLPTNGELWFCSIVRDTKPDDPRRGAVIVRLLKKHERMNAAELKEELCRKALKWLVSTRLSEKREVDRRLRRFMDICPIWVDGRCYKAAAGLYLRGTECVATLRFRDILTNEDVADAEVTFQIPPPPDATSAEEWWGTVKDLNPPRETIEKWFRLVGTRKVETYEYGLHLEVLTDLGMAFSGTENTTVYFSLSVSGSGSKKINLHRVCSELPQSWVPRIREDAVSCGILWSRERWASEITELELWVSEEVARLEADSDLSRLNWEEPAPQVSNSIPRPTHEVGSRSFGGGDDLERGPYYFLKFVSGRTLSVETMHGGLSAEEIRGLARGKLHSLVRETRQGIKNVGEFLRENEDESLGSLFQGKMCPWNERLDEILERLYPTTSPSRA